MHFSSHLHTWTFLVSQTSLDPDHDENNSPTYPTVPFINSQGTLENMRLVPNHLSFLLVEVHTHLSLEPSHCGLSVVPGIPDTLTSLFCLALQFDIHGLSFQESVNT